MRSRPGEKPVISLCSVSFETMHTFSTPKKKKYSLFSLVPFLVLEATTDSARLFSSCYNSYNKTLFLQSCFPNFHFPTAKNWSLLPPLPTRLCRYSRIAAHQWLAHQRSARLQQSVEVLPKNSLSKPMRAPFSILGGVLLCTVKQGT